MNLLNDLFNVDDIKIKKLNKKYILLVIIIIILIVVLLIIKKDNYYQNSFSVSDGKILLVVEKEYINKVKETKVINIEGIMCDYSINEIVPLDDNILVSINLSMEIRNVNGGSYKIYLGKERLFDYIIKIIKK